MQGKQNLRDIHDEAFRQRGYYTHSLSESYVRLNGEVATTVAITHALFSMQTPILRGGGA